MIVVTVFEPNGISIWFKNCQHDHILFTVKGKGNIVFSVHRILGRSTFEEGNIRNSCLHNNITITPDTKRIVILSGIDRSGNIHS